MSHVSVLLQEVVEGLSLHGGVVLDATVNGGGMSEAILAADPTVRVVATDADESALLRAEERLKRFGDRISFHHVNFRELDRVLAERDVPGIDGAIFDLGLSSHQLDQSGRGFSFRFEEPLLMTFAARPAKDAVTAREAVNEWSAETLETVIRAYGEEPKARRIAEAIVRAREKRAIETSAELAEIIERAVPRRGKIHPATKAFQALRIAVNDELRALDEALEKAWKALKPGGRLLVISFHSLEDRPVKRFFRAKADEGLGRLLTKKPIVPSEAEAKENPRSRSAKLRIIEKI
ncbi:MAG TPA: 16S rRNA (cytosine(1402)-N(4))-methyltransferase RsmH [Candidatus Paceibacterota bacterium]|nr:16S rRNA (cytosine(1402)-N(4))-methyltransferase RsmH [Candidatus Paceibacterota bacterium]